MARNTAKAAPARTGNGTHTMTEQDEELTTLGASIAEVLAAECTSARLHGHADGTIALREAP